MLLLSPVFHRKHKEVLAALADRTQLEGVAGLGSAVLQSDESVHVLGLAAYKVLQMDGRGTSGILADVIGGIYTGNIDPAGISRIWSITMWLSAMEP